MKKRRNPISPAFTFLLFISFFLPVLTTYAAGQGAATAGNPRQSMRARILWRMSLPDLDETPEILATGDIVCARSPKGYQSYYAVFRATDGARLWSLERTKDMDFLETDGRSVYVAFADRIQAFDLLTGRAGWRFVTPDTEFDALTQPGIKRLWTVHGLVCLTSVVCRKSTFRVLDSGTGAPLWSLEEGPFIDHELDLVTENTMLLESRNYHEPKDYVRAFDLRTGAKLWEQDFEGSHFCMSAASDGVIYIGHHREGVLRAREERTGKVLWQYTAQEFLGRNMILDHGFIYLSSGMKDEPGRVFALNAGTGGVLWKTAVEKDAYSFEMQDGILYVRNPCLTQVWAHDAETGKSLCTIDTGADDVNFAVFGDVAYSTSEDYPKFTLKAVNARSGEVLWRHEGESFFDIPVVLDGVAYCGSQGGILWAITERTGEVLWQYHEERGEPITSVTLGHGMLYAATPESLLAFQLPASSGSSRSQQEAVAAPGSASGRAEEVESGPSH